jgi:hypothetical protein
MVAPPTPIVFELYAHPLGNEIDINWQFEQKLDPLYQLYIFKRSKSDITNEEITNYIANPVPESITKGLFVYYTLSNNQLSVRDVDVEGKQKYYYRAVVIEKAKILIDSGTVTSGGATSLSDTGATWTIDALIGKWVKIISGAGAGQVRKITDNTATSLTIAAWSTPLPNSTSLYEIFENNISDILSANILAKDFEAVISVADTKDLVIECFKKLLRSVARQTKSEIMVYNEFPVEVTDPCFIVVTRSSGENSYRFWSDISATNGNLILTGDIDTDVLSVIWECADNPRLRDKLTNIFRGTKRVIKRYLNTKGGDGILDVKISIIGDGIDQRYTGKNLMYGGLLINVLIQNLISSQEEDELLNNLFFETEFINDNG